MQIRNPFRPTAGANPPILIGRDDELLEFEDALEDGPGAPGRLVRFSGARGVGKTVVLTELRSRAQPRGWVVLADTAYEGLADRLAVAAEQARRTHDAAPSSRRVSSASGGVAGVSAGVGWTDPLPEPQSLRWRLQGLLDLVEPLGGGVLITVDEVQGASLPDLRELAATFQHLVTEDRQVALALAGLPSSMSDTLNDRVLTFLRRAVPFELNAVDLGLVGSAFRTTLNNGNLTITDDGLAQAVEATAGYPFMIQLVGHQLWRRSDEDGHINTWAAGQAVAQARRRLGSTVHQTALADLSEIDRSYLVAMAQDEGPSRTATIADRLGVRPAYASVYRARLIEAGMIQASARGSVDFTLPYLRDYLREHASQHPMKEWGGQHNR